MKILKNNWTIAILANIIIFIVIMSLTDVTYESNDDYGIALRIVDGYSSIFLINYYLCKILVPLQAVMAGRNVFVLFQIVSSLCAFIVVSKVILDADKTVWFKIVCMLVIATFSIDHYCMIQYTKTSSFLIAAGLVILVDAVTKKRNIGYIAGGMIFVYLGASLRFINMYVGIGFAAVFMLFWAIYNFKEIKGNGYFERNRLIAYAVIVILLAGTYVMDYCSDNQDVFKDYKVYNSNRSKITDYPVYEHYDQNRAEYEATGISANDVYLIAHWYHDFNGAASIDNLKKINEIYDNSQSGLTSEKISVAVQDFKKSIIDDMHEKSRTGIHIIILLMLAAGGILLFKPKYWLYIIALGFTAVAVYIYLYYGDRTVYRALYIADINPTLWLLYFYQSGLSREDKAAKYAKPVIAVIISVVILSMQSGLYEYCNAKSDAIKGQLMPTEVTEYFNDHPDNFYIFSNGDKELSAYYPAALKMPGKDFEKNMLVFGGWGTTSPYNMDRMGRYGLSNLFGNIIDRENIYIVENRNLDRLTEYFNKWYGNDEKSIIFELVEEFDGYHIYRAKCR